VCIHFNYALKNYFLVKMPIKIEPLDSSATEENITLILGKNILLKIIEDPEKQRLLENKIVKQFISITNLCHEDIRLLIEELALLEDSIVPTSQVEPIPIEAIREPSSLKPGETEISQETKEEIISVSSEMQAHMKEYTKVFLDQISNLMRKTGEEIVNKAYERTASIGEEIKKKTGFEILVPSNILLCPNCKMILSLEEFSGSEECQLCKNEITRKQAERIYVHRINYEVKKVLKKNLWFEAYLARLLRKLGCKTWTSVHVMGASGILHEIDVLAIRKGTVLIGECKTGKVSRNDVFNFCTKVGDLKSHVSILALINKLPEPETREFVKKNPAIIRLENMGKTKEVEILTDLKQRLSIKT